MDLDIAFCNHLKRGIFLECIAFGSCMWREDEGIVFNCQGIYWLTSREIKLRHLEYENVLIEEEREPGDYSYLYEDGPVDDVIMADEISSFSSYSFRLLINDKSISDDSIGRIIDGCEDIHSIHLEKCEKITDKSIIQIAENCSGLNYADFNNCPDISHEGILAIANNRLLLQTLNIDRVFFPRDSNVMIMKVIENCPNRQELRLGGLSHITDSCLLKIAELRRPIRTLHLGFTKITDIDISRVADECRGIEPYFL
jgi:hypothetical protein